MSVHIRAHDICLDIPIFLQRERNARGWGGMFLGAAFDPPKRKLARLLQDISFDLREGDRLAILGRNGAGKSTLLRVLNRVYQPTSGTLSVKGSCQALLNMSLGFSMEATVRENIFLRGIAMGLKSSYLRDQIEPILEFSGLHDKVGHRLRTLSSGQKMRLGFAISTSVQNDIMLMDEWVGAGDAEFFYRAKERMQSRVGGSKIVVLASHSVSLLESICNKGIVLEQGRTLHMGDIGSALKAYHELMADLREGRESNLHTSIPRDVLVYGSVSKFIAQGEGVVLVEGWCVDAEGALPGALTVQLHGHRHTPDELVRIGRPDVMRRFGLTHDGYGFQALFKLPGVETAGDLEDAQVLVGMNSDAPGTPLQLSPSAAEQMRLDV